MKRILLNIALFISIVYLDWWITLIFAICGVFIFDNFYEAVMSGFLIDLLYGTPSDTFFGFWFIYAILFTLVYILCEYEIKKNIRFYETI